MHRQRPHSSHPIHVCLPDGSTITSTHTGLLPLSQLPTSARQAHIFPALTTGSLLSICQLCDTGCQAEFNRNTVQIHHHTQLVASGTRTGNGLWNIQMTTTPPPNTKIPSMRPTALLTTLAQQTAGDRIAFLHAAAGYPVASTWLAVIKQGFYMTRPGFTARAVLHHLPISTVSVLGHLDQQRANRQSTKTPLPLPPAPASTTPTYTIFAACQPITGQIFSDLPGCFVVPSS
jgi:hypothetical protein